MSVLSRESDGVVAVQVSNYGLSKGWDILDIDARGRSLMPLREGEFKTKDQAVAAGLARGHAALKADNTSPGI